VATGNAIATPGTEAAPILHIISVGISAITKTGDPGCADTYIDEVIRLGDQARRRWEDITWDEGAEEPSGAVQIKQKACELAAALQNLGPCDQIERRNVKGLTDYLPVELSSLQVFYAQD